MTEKNTKNKSFVSGAVILGLAGILVKVLGAAFRIPLGNIIGDDGMGYYQTAYPIYVFFLTIATAGIPTAISRMVAERYALGQPYEAHRVFRISTILLCATGVVSASVLFFGAGIITDMILEPGAIYCMKAISLALIFVPLMGSYRGYFQGRQNMRPTAVSQFVEQLFRVAVGLSLAVILLPKGLPVAAAGASFGATAGGIFGFLGMLIIYKKHKKEINAELEGVDKTPIESTKKILLALLTIAVPITIGSSIMPIINVLDTAIVKSRLIAIGYDSDTARSLYGQLTGFAAPLINFPQVLTQAVSMSLVPVVATAYKTNNHEFMNKNIALGLRYAVAIGAPCAVGMAVLSEPILLMFYPSKRESAISAAGCLSILAVGVLMLALVHASTGTLQGIGKQHIPVINLCIGAVFKIIVTFTLTGIPALNVRGAACGTVAAYAAAALLNIIAVRKYTHLKIDIKLTFIKPLLSSTLMGALVWLSYRLLHGFLGNSVSAVLSIGVGILVYGICVLVLGILTKEEIEGLPKGKKITAILCKFKLLK